MEVQYVSQIQAIGTKATESNLDLQEVSHYYHTCHAVAQQSFSHPRIPPIYHQFVAERETWKHYFGADEFPGKDPLYDCFIAALDHIEREPERHPNREDEASQGSRIEALRGRMQQLESLALQKDFVIKSKDELLRIKEETLVAHKELMSEKGRVIQAKENELKEARALIGSSRNTQEKKKTVQNLKNTITQKDQNIEKLQGTITQKNKTIEELKKKASTPKIENTTQKNQSSLEQRDTLRKDDEIRTLENQLAHRDHVVRTLEFAYENLEKSSEERITALWDEVKNKDEKIEELQNARGRYLEDQKYQATSDNEGRKIKKEKKPKIKPEPMEY